MAFWRLQALHGPQLRGLQRSAELNPEAPSSLQALSQEAPSAPKTLTWTSKALAGTQLGVPKPFRVMKNHRKTYVFKWFFKVSQSIGKLCSNMLFTYLRNPKNLPWTPSWRPRSTPGSQLGGLECSKDLHLEAQSAPQTSTWRLKTFPKRQLGGSRRSKTLTWGSQAPQRAQLGVPKPLQTPNLEAQSSPKMLFWRAKAVGGVQLGGPKLLQNLTFEKSEASRNQTPRIRATRSKSIEKT